MLFSSIIHYCFLFNSLWATSWLIMFKSASLSSSFLHFLQIRAKVSFPLSNFILILLLLYCPPCFRWHFWQLGINSVILLILYILREYTGILTFKANRPLFYKKYPHKVRRLVGF